jgi:prepilin peptidase CpaA
VEKVNIEFVYLACTLFCALIGAVYDVITHKIPNAFTLPAIVFALLLHFTFGGWRQLLASAAGGLCCGFLFFLFYLAGGMGAGDVKLITAAGCSAGIGLIAPLLIWTSLAGGIMALCLALYRRQLKRTLLNLRMLVAHHRTAGLVPHPECNVYNTQTLRLPYAVAIAAGSALSLCLLVLQVAL